MITLITGAPGTGKTAALVKLLSELSKTRAVYCDGIPELTIDHHPLNEPSKWHESVPDGSIVVIDEVQRVWRPRGPGVKVPPDIAALETHRHRALDFYVITQSPRLVDSNVRGLVGRHIHLRDIGVLGRWWYEWPECSDQCATSWKQAPIKKRYTLPKAILSSYKSATEHIKPVRSFPFMLIVLFMALVMVAFLSWRSYNIIAPKINPGAANDSKTPAPSIAEIASRGSALSSAQTPAEYDASLFVPRISSKPESAAAYDHLRVVTAMPLVTGGICMGSKCRCLTSQNTDAGLSDDECRKWLANPPFNPYQLPPSSNGTAGADKQPPASRSPPVQSEAAPASFGPALTIFGSS
jgi:zona occludens toxin